MTKVSDVRCPNAYHDLIFVTPSSITGLVVASIVLALCTVTANIVLLYYLIKTKQLNNPSLRIIIFLSVFKLCFGAIGLTAEIAVYVRAHESRDCHLEIVSEFFMMFLGHVIGYVIGLIGYDRYFRIKYLTRYNKVVQERRIEFTLFIFIFVSLIQAVVEVRYATFNVLLQLEMASNVLVVIFVILPYILSILKIRRYKRGVLFKHIIKTVDGVITRTATGIATSVIILYIPYITINLVYVFVPKRSPILKQGWFHLLHFVFYTILHASPFVSAIIFLSYNSKIRRRILKYFLGRLQNENRITLWIRGNRVAVI